MNRNKKLTQLLQAKNK